MRDTIIRWVRNIVRECIASGKNYGEMALKYQASYQQARTWSLWFEEMGKAGPEDRRGRRKKDQTPHTELERTQIKIEQFKHKLYLSAILDLCDRRIVSYVISERNDSPLVCKTFDKAVKANPDAHPLFHSGRGFQYTGRAFYHKLQKAGMAQSIAWHTIDNGPMEGFWGILKRERYYGRFYQ